MQEPQRERECRLRSSAGFCLNQQGHHIHRTLATPANTSYAACIAQG